MKHTDSQGLRPFTTMTWSSQDLVVVSFYGNNSIENNLITAVSSWSGLPLPCLVGTPPTSSNTKPLASAVRPALEPILCGARKIPMNAKNRFLGLLADSIKQHRNFIRKHIDQLQLAVYKSRHSQRDFNRRWLCFDLQPSSFGRRGTQEALCCLEWRLGSAVKPFSSATFFSLFRVYISSTPHETRSIISRPKGLESVLRAALTRRDRSREGSCLSDGIVSSTCQ